MSSPGSRLLPVFIALLFPYSAAQAQINGTLFTTPEQRDYLNKIREDMVRQSQSKGFNLTEAVLPEISENPEEIPAEYYTLNGIMKLRDNSHQIWLNNSSLLESQLPPFMSLTNENGQTVLSIQDSLGNRHNIKTGQTLELTSGVITDNLQKRTLSPETIAETSIQDELPDRETAQANEPSSAAKVEPASLLNSLLEDPEQIQRLIEAVQMQGLQNNDRN